MHAEQKQDTVACFDTEKVEKIFYNLLSNAIKYTPEGGSIDITVESDGKTYKYAWPIRDKVFCPKNRNNCLIALNGWELIRNTPM